MPKNLALTNFKVRTHLYATILNYLMIFDENSLVDSVNTSKIQIKEAFLYETKLIFCFVFFQLRRFKSTGKKWKFKTHFIELKQSTETHLLRLMRRTQYNHCWSFFLFFIFLLITFILNKCVTYLRCWVSRCWTK